MVHVGIIPDPPRPPVSVAGDWSCSGLHSPRPLPPDDQKAARCRESQCHGQSHSTNIPLGRTVSRSDTTRNGSLLHNRRVLHLLHFLISALIAPCGSLPSHQIRPSDTPRYTITMEMGPKMLVGANERRSEDLQVEAVQGRGLSEFSAEIGIPADHGALPESVVRLENEFAIQETGARLPVVRAGAMEGSSISTLAIGVPRSVVRRAMAELSSGDVDDRTALATELINRSSPEFAARYVEERLREYRRGAARKKHHSPFDSLVTVSANATTPLFVAAREEESVPPTRTLQSDNAMNPQHKSPWGIYTFRDLWTHHSIPCTLLVAAIAFGC